MAFVTNFKHQLRRRFARLVTKSESCWLWSGSTRDGYGVMRIGGRSGRLVGAHRVSWFLAHGELPIGQCVCHRCNNKRCVKPEHLYLASSAQNMSDAWRDNLCQRGGQRVGAKLTDTAVAVIRSSRDRTLQSLATEFGVSIHAVWLARQGRTWSHV